MGKNKIFIGLLVLTCFFTVTIGCEKNDKKHSLILPITKTECMLCGNNKKSLKSVYRYYQGVGILCLNDWRVLDFHIAENDHLENGGTSYVWEKNGLYSTRIEQIANRGISLVHYESGDENILDMDKMAGFLCSDCLKEVEDAIHIYGEHKDRKEKAVCLIEFPSMRLYGIQQNFQYYILEDYYVQSHCKGNSIDLTVFFAPDSTLPPTP